MKAETRVEGNLDEEVKMACGSDMMSDVLAFVKDQSVLLTGLMNPQVVRTAEMMDMHCIVFVRGKRPTSRFWPWPGRKRSPCWHPLTGCLRPAGCCIPMGCGEVVKFDEHAAFDLQCLETILPSGRGLWRREAPAQEARL